jgi:hypothetical protein
MSKMPVLDTCTEVTALIKITRWSWRNLKPQRNYIVFFNKAFGSAQRYPMLRQQRVVS